MKQPKNEKPMPLWAIWIITLVAVVAWCGVNGEHQGENSAPARAVERI
ncbi:TPA: hypothetical protein QDC03_006502 [Burkholderia cepacia]|nr:hypothetical protein [Burkholderia cepacia]HDR9511293.1 hypothetical protein [Burkholderia cepacia]